MNGEENKKAARKNILVVDDSEMNRSILADILEDEYEILEACNGVEAVSMLHRLGTQISLILLDINMPEMNGFEVLSTMNKYHWIDDIPVIMISAEDGSSFVENAYELGVTDFISRPFDSAVVHRRVVNTIMLYAKQQKLIGIVADQIYEKQKSNSLMIEILSHIVEFRNGESGLHVIHIRIITEMILKYISKKIPQYQMSHSQISLISIASALHDVGKLAIPEEILNKPGRLTKEEFEIMKSHSMEGAKMLENLPFYQDEPLVKTAYEICRWHHERYDGRGYPDGLKGDEIPISAQIVALADVYDALTSERVYKPAYPHDKAIQMILNGECGTFNPVLFECLSEISNSLKEELSGDFLIQDSHKDLQDITEELMQHEEMSAFAKTMDLLGNEQIKYQFFTSMSEEIQFEYTESPPMVTLSKWGAKRLDMNEITLDPLHDSHCFEIISPETVEELRATLKGTSPEQPFVQYDCRIRLDGKEQQIRFICRTTWSAEETPKYTGVIGKISGLYNDGSHRIDLQAVTSHDGLTSLPNQPNAMKQIHTIFDEDQQKNYTLILFDLDHLKRINEEYGHIFGDQVLKCIAGRLQAISHPGDIIARIGGDEFLLYMKQRPSMKQEIERIFHILGEDIDGLAISVCMGIAPEATPGQDEKWLYQCADKALRTAKNKGRACLCFYGAEAEAI